MTTPTTRALSAKQKEIITVIGKANPDGTFIDLDQLIMRLSYKPSKDAIHFSIRALENRGLIEKKVREKRRQQSRRTLALTIRGYEEFKIIKLTR